MTAKITAITTITDAIQQLSILTKDHYQATRPTGPHLKRPNRMNIDIKTLQAIYRGDADEMRHNHPHIALATVQAHDELPMPFMPVAKGLPPSDKPVLAIRRSGYNSSKYEIITARYQPDYRPLSPWRDLSMNAVTDSGEPVLGWFNADQWLFGKA